MTRSGRNVRVALAAASFLALLEIFRSGLTRVLEGNWVSFAEFFHWVIPLWLGVVLVSPWCAFMAWRFPVRSGQVAGTLLVHVGGAAMFVAMHLGLLTVFSHVLTLAQPLLGHAHAAHIYVFYVGMEASIYSAVVVVVMLLEARREAAERRLAAAQLEQRLASARLESLQAQIRPHFLFNTLNTLAVLARRGDGAAVDHAIGDLGELLRASFDSSGRHEITLGEELELVERYLALQRLRFPERLHVDWEVAPDVRSARVPALLVQPLVENAIEHGLASARGGQVRVRARRVGGMLELEVSDDGPGFVDAASGSAGGMGIANTRERLALLHGAAATLECTNLDAGGGRVVIRLPWRDGAGGDRA